MCTAILWNSYFGRTLDYELSFGEQVVLVPRRMPLEFCIKPPLKSHYAILGMAAVQSGVPLFFDGMNERGLAMAGLQFAEFADYSKGGTLAPFELIPWVLGQCADLAQARRLLRGQQLCDISFAKDLPNAPLHWMIADGSGALILEPTAEGLQMYDATEGVLTNSPPYPYHKLRYEELQHLSAEPAPHSARRGLQAVGLPGDYSSASRFIRAAFIRAHLRGEGEGAFYSMTDNISVPRGCIRLPQGDAFTRYTCCCDLKGGIYSYTTHQTRAPIAFSFAERDLDGDQIFCCKLEKTMI